MKTFISELLNEFFLQSLSFGQGHFEQKMNSIDDFVNTESNNLKIRFSKYQQYKL